MLEEFVAIIFGRIVIGIFGKYTLLAFYKLTNNKQKIQWLTNPEHELDAFTGGCLISLVGAGSFTAFIGLLVYIFS